jgi:hypothetical protein
MERGIETAHWMLKLPELLLVGTVTCVAERETYMAPPIGDTAIVSSTIEAPAGAGPLSVIMPFAMPPPVRDVGTVEGVIATD